MSVDERTRHAIHGRFEELLGPELAGAFMSYLPPVGWADVATKRDLDALQSALGYELRAELHKELTRVSERMDDRFRATVFALIGTNATLAGIAFAAARFA